MQVFPIFIANKIFHVTVLLLFTVLHVMQTRYCDEISVRPSVRPSVTRVNCDKTVERSVQIYIPYERTFILVF